MSDQQKPIVIPIVDREELLYIGGRRGGGPYPLAQLLYDLVKIMEEQDGIRNLKTDDR